MEKQFPLRIGMAADSSLELVTILKFTPNHSFLRRRTSGGAINVGSSIIAGLNTNPSKL